MPWSSAHLPSVLFLLRQRRVAAGNGLVTGLGTTIKYVRRTSSGAAGNGFALESLSYLADPGLTWEVHKVILRAFLPPFHLPLHTSAPPPLSVGSI